MGGGCHMEKSMVTMCHQNREVENQFSERRD